MLVTPIMPVTLADKIGDAVSYEVGSDLTLEMLHFSLCFLVYFGDYEVLQRQ